MGSGNLAMHVNNEHAVLSPNHNRAFSCQNQFQNQLVHPWLWMAGWPGLAVSLLFLMPEIILTGVTQLTFYIVHHR